MDWNTLLGALIGAAAGVLGSFVSSWAQFRKDRVAFNRDRVTSAAFQYLRDCDKLLDLEIGLAIVKADCARRELAIEDRLSQDDRNTVVSAFRTAETDLSELALLCPTAFHEAKALYDAAHDISEEDTIVNDNDHSIDVTNAVDDRYDAAKLDFIQRIRKLADL